MVIHGFRIGSTDLSDVDMELGRCRASLEKVTAKVYHRLLGEEAAFLCIAVNNCLAESTDCKPLKLIIRHPAYRWMPAVAMVLAVMVQYYPPVHHAVGHLEIFFSRIPIFLIGINLGSWVKQKRTLEGQAVWLVLAAFVMSLMMCVEFEESWRGRFPLFIERMVYIPLTVSIVLLLDLLLGKTPAFVRRKLAFVGTISLELYLIHIQFVLKYVTPYKLGYCLTALVMIAVSLVLAWLLHKAVDKVVR